MTAAEPVAKTQQWFRSLSDRLLASFRGSAAIEHAVTKGESREQQILDVLIGVLPTRATLRRDVVIVDSGDQQSPKFDGVLCDRANWPRLFQEGDLEVAMIESVLAALEVKSTLDTKEIADIVSKAAKIRRMSVHGNDALLQASPRVAGFAYQCGNPNLAFFDFSVAVEKDPLGAPSLVAILGTALFGIGGRHEDVVVPLDSPLMGAFPIWMGTGTDTLLAFVYFVSRWITPGAASEEIFRRYGHPLFSRMGSFFFDAPFRAAIAGSESARSTARDFFKDTAGQDISTPYTAARKALGLP